MESEGPSEQDECCPDHTIFSEIRFNIILTSIPRSINYISISLHHYLLTKMSYAFWTSPLLCNVPRNIFNNAGQIASYQTLIIEDYPMLIIVDTVYSVHLNTVSDFSAVYAWGSTLVTS